MKKVTNKTYAIILLIVLVAIGGIVLYGNNKNPKIKTNSQSEGPANIPKGL